MGHPRNDGDVFIAGLCVVAVAEQHGSAVLRSSGVSLTAGSGQSGGNMADKEVRSGIAGTSLFAAATTSSSDGTVNGGLDAFTPAGGAVPLVNMFVGEVIFGGDGSGLYGMIFMIVIAVFVAGLMVGRTPEYLGKKIEAREIKLASLGALFRPCLTRSHRRRDRDECRARRALQQRGARLHRGAVRVDSKVNTNGSAFAGYGGTSFSASLGAVAMLLGRIVPMFAALALAGAVGRSGPCRLGRDVPDGWADVRRPARRDDPARRRADDLPALMLGPIVERLSA